MAGFGGGKARGGGTKATRINRGGILLTPGGPRGHRSFLPSGPGGAGGGGGGARGGKGAGGVARMGGGAPAGGEKNIPRGGGR